MNWSVRTLSDLRRAAVISHKASSPLLSKSGSHASTIGTEIRSHLRQGGRDPCCVAYAPFFVWQTCVAARYDVDLRAG